jgi:hypothetical protein
MICVKEVVMVKKAAKPKAKTAKAKSSKKGCSSC